MPSDRSRPPDPASDAYTGVAMQQGRVILDRDFNAQRDIGDRRDQQTARDLIGPCGTPDDGFAITAPLHFLPRLEIAAPLLRLPFPRLPFPFSPPSATHDLRIRSGTMFVGGLRVEWPGSADGSPIEYSYFGQPDWLLPDPPAAPQTEIVFLQLDEHEVSATEDPDLLDVALGGPDTTQRLRLLRTVRRQATAAGSCTPAWQGLLDAWQAQGYGFDPATMRRLPQARLQAAFTAIAGSTDPCDPVATGGFLGAENQLVRVQWSPPQGNAATGTLVWGYDDASFVYRAASDQTGTRLTLTRDPPDAYHFPGTGQFVEVLRTTTLLGSGAEQTAEADGVTTPRCIAEQNGFVTTLAAAYDPTSSDRALVLSQPLPAAYATSTEPLFVRIWQGGGPMTASGGSLELVDPVARASTGIVVTVSVPGGTAIAPGSFWMMALRPGTPLTLTPASLLAAPQPPDGPRSWACPLAVVEWPAGSTNPVIHDCRVRFDDLIALTRRPAGCCSVSVSPSDITLDFTLQTALDGLTGPGTLCLAPGTYALAAPLRIGAAQSGLSIVAENGATLAAAQGAEAAFADGLIVVAGATQVTLRGLTLLPPAVAIPAGLFAGLANLSRIALPAMQDPWSVMLSIVNAEQATMRTMIAVRAAGSPSLTLADCAVQFGPPADAATGGPLFGIGLLAGGACANLAVRGCTFDATALAVTQTPGILQQTGFFGPAGFLPPQRTANAALQGAIGCLASPFVAQFLSVVAPRPPVPIVPLPPIPIPIGLLNRVFTPNLTTEATLRAAVAPATPVAGTVRSAAVRPAETLAAGAIAGAAGNVAGAASPSLNIAQPITSNLLNLAPGALNLTFDPIILHLDTADSFTTVLDLTGAVFEDNVFDSLTLAVGALGMIDRVRIADNTVVNGGGGFWLRPIEEPRFTFTTSATIVSVTGASGANPVVAGDSMWLKLALLQQEVFLPWLLSLLLPLPAGALTPVFASPQGGISLGITGNAVAALAGAMGNAPPEGGPALAVVTGVYTQGVDIGPGLILADNRLQARTAPGYPAAVLAVSGRLAATGNLFSNEAAGSPPSSTALAIYPANNGGHASGELVLTSRICVTGNVLEGASNLALLTRTDGANLQPPFNTWLPFNASS